MRDTGYFTLPKDESPAKIWSQSEPCFRWDRFLSVHQEEQHRTLIRSCTRADTSGYGTASNLPLWNGLPLHCPCHSCRICTVHVHHWYTPIYPAGIQYHLTCQAVQHDGTDTDCFSGPHQWYSCWRASSGSCHWVFLIQILDVVCIVLSVTCNDYIKIFLNHFPVMMECAQTQRLSIV